MRSFFKKPYHIVCLVFALLIILLCVVGPLFSPYTGLEMDLQHLYGTPSRDHWIGTDALGRDLLTRFMIGGRRTLKACFISVAGASLIGTALGLLTGFLDGLSGAGLVSSRFVRALPSLTLRVCEALSAIPILILAMLFDAIFGFGKGYYIYALLMAYIPPTVNVVYAATLKVMGQEYIEAARALGTSNAAILKQHVLPNILSPLVTHISGLMAASVVMCTILGYLGLCVNPPSPEWGALIHESRDALMVHPSVVLLPAFLLVIFILSIQQIGSGITDALADRHR